jgi:hypothetical protein
MSNSRYALAYINGESNDSPLRSAHDATHDLTRRHISLIPLLSRYRGHERRLERLIDQWEALDR